MNERLVAAEALLTEFGWEVPHARQVRDLALTLFDQLQPLHGLGLEERDILAAAALLHDIGWTVGATKHHKESYRLIREHAPRLAGFTLSEVELIANVARYHRKALPSLDHEPFANLAVPQRQVVQRLAALLRLADGLDRGHHSAVTAISCAVTADRVLISIRLPASDDTDLGGAARKRDLFEVVFGRPVEFAVLSM